jgi:hypothetical protein
MDARGEAVVVWTRTRKGGEGVLSPDGGEGPIQAASRTPAGHWGAPVTISAHPGGNARLALSASGEAVAAWETAGGAVWAAVRSPHGRWAAARRLSPARSRSPDVAIDSRGDAVVVWDHEEECCTVVGEKGPSELGVSTVQATERKAAGAWGSVSNVSARSFGESEATVAMSSSGQATVVWTHEPVQVGGGLLAIEASARPPRGSWEKPVTIAGGPGAGLPFLTALHLAADGATEEIATWGESVGAAQDAAGPFRIRAAYLSPAGAWESPVELFEAQADPVLAVGATGDALLAWQQPVSESVVAGGRQVALGTARDEVAERPAGGNWTTPLALTPTWTEVATEPVVLRELGTPPRPVSAAVDSRGDAAIVWEQATRGVQVIELATRLHGSKWSVPLALSGSKYAFEPRVSLDQHGHGVAVWQRVIGKHRVVTEAASFTVTSAG